jgi:hypothetical protein
MAGLIVAAAVYLVVLVKPLWFYFDDWSFLLRRSLTHDTVHSLFAPHNEHWSTLPVIAWRVLYSVFGLRHYLPFGLMPVTAHLLAAVVLYLLLRRSGAHAWVAVLTTGLLLFMGAGSSDILWAFQIGFVGGAAFGLTTLLVLETDTLSRGRTVLSWLLLVASLMCAGVGISMVAWAVLFATARHGPRTALMVGAVPTATYLVWFGAIGHTGNTGSYAPWDVIVPTMIVGMGILWQWVVPVNGVGLPILVGLLLASLLARADERLRALSVSGFGALIVDYLLISATRGQHGDYEAATADRYAYVGILFTLPAFALGAQVLWVALNERTGLRAGVWGVLTVMFVLLGAGQLHTFQQARLQELVGFKARVVAAGELSASNQVLLSTRPEPVLAPDIRASFLGRADVQRSLPALQPGAQARLDAAAYLQVGVAKDPLPVPTADRILSLVGGKDLTTVGGCVKGTTEGYTAFAMPTNAQVSMKADAPAVTAILVRSGRKSRSTSWQIKSGRTFWIGSSAPGARLRVGVPPGRFEICATNPPSG